MHGASSRDGYGLGNARLHVFDDGYLGLLTSADTLAPVVRQFLTAEAVPEVRATIEATSST